MAPRDACVECGRPCTGRFCHEHFALALQRERDLRESDPALWQQREQERVRAEQDWLEKHSPRYVLARHKM